MKTIIATVLAIAFSFSVSAQLIATVRIDKPIPGLCNDKEVYALFPGFAGQVQAVCPASKYDILKRLQSDVSFLKQNPKFSGKGMVGMMINCKGQVVECMMDNKTKSSELDNQIVAVFNSLGEWKAATLDGKNVDSHRIWEIKIKKGVILID